MAFKITNKDQYGNVNNITLSPEALKKINAWSEENPPSESDLSIAAEEVLEVLYYQEFSGTGKHWSYDGSRSSPQESSNPDERIYHCDISHTWDWKDIYSVSSGSCIVCINWKARTIAASDFKYYCAG